MELLLVHQAEQLLPADKFRLLVEVPAAQASVPASAARELAAVRWEFAVCRGCHLEESVRLAAARELSAVRWELAERRGCHLEESVPASAARAPAKEGLAISVLASVDSPAGYLEPAGQRRDSASAGFPAAADLL